MMEKRWFLPEVWFTLALAALTAAFSFGLGLPFNLPSGERAAFVGIHYLYPLVGLCIWGAVAAFGQRRDLARTFLIALPCYAAVLVLHFNLKLWSPHINPMRWDWLYWHIDQTLRPLVLGCFALRRLLEPVVPYDSNMYMIAFIAMFYVSFTYHAIRTPGDFRTLFLAALIFQGLGALAYLIMPALGPFIYENGLEVQQTGAQAAMLDAYYANVAGGASWIARNGSTHITAGLAAMPSLHSGGSFLFLLFAWRYGRSLLPIYVVLFGYIAIDAVASRWHYLIDVPVGMTLAYASLTVAEKLTPRERVPAPRLVNGESFFMAALRKWRHRSALGVEA